MFKVLNVLKNNKQGFINTTQAIVVSAIMLGVLFLSFFIFNSKVEEEGEYIDNKVVTEFDKLETPKLPPIDNDENNDDDFIVDDTNSGKELDNDNDNKENLKQITITLERNKSKDREVIITLPNLDEIVDIKSSNEGSIEIISVNGDEVKIKIKDGKPNDYIVLSGSYVPGGSKLVDVEDSHGANYSDKLGYTGVLERYLSSYSPSERIVVNNYVVESMTNNFPSTQSYSEKGYSTTLTKSGNSTSTVIKGSPSHSKNVEELDNNSYVEKINDNGIETSYTGTLTQYVYSGEASISKNVTISESSFTNSFNNTVSYNKDSYKGTLNKSGNVVTTIDKGSVAHSKTVNVQDSPNYIENINDNGISTSYSGTLSQYVYQGSESKTKSVTNQTSTYYNENINDNGISTNYSGTLSQYVASGYAPDAKTYTTTEYNYSNSTFANTKNVTDGLYSGTINKSGTVNQYSGGSAPISKYVSGQSSSWYNDGSYSGSLSQYLAGGSASDSKYVTGQTSSYYNDGTYSGSLSQYVYSGSAGDSKYVTGQTSSYYNDGTYSGSLSQYVYSGSAAQSAWASASSCSNNVVVSYNSSGKISSKTSITECPSSKPISAVIDGVTYSGTGYKSASSTRTCAQTGYPNATCTEPWTATYSGTVSKPDTRVYRYQGTVYKPDTIVYRYQGTVYKPDTRTYAYAGTVWTADTRYNYWTQEYSGVINRPDSRVYRYQGTVSKPDTRIYKYQGTVTKPDTRIYKYTQNYTGTVKTDDTRVYKYRGTITKPDTRVYKYTQIYNGVLNIPEIAVYRYKGIVTKPLKDTRVIENYYKYDLNIQYKEKIN